MLCAGPSAADRDKKGPGSRKPPKAVLLKQAEARKAELEALAGTEEGKVGASQYSSVSNAGGRAHDERRETSFRFRQRHGSVLNGLNCSESASAGGGYCIAHVRPGRCTAYQTIAAELIAEPMAERSSLWRKGAVAI